MAIRFKHDVAAGMIGSYAAGQAAGQKRKQKYGMDLLEQNQRHQQRLDELAFRDGLGGLGRSSGRAGSRSGVGGAMGGVWEDPLAGGASVEQRVRQRAQQRAAGRKYRLGIGYQGDLLPKFVSENELEARKEAEDRKIEWGREDDIWKRNQEAELEKEKRRTSLDARKSTADGLFTSIPDNIDQKLHAELTKEASQIADALQDPNVDWNDPKQAGPIEARVEAFRDRLTNLPERDYNKGGLVFDTTTNRWRPAKEGERATHMDNGPNQEPVEMQWVAQEREKTALETKTKEEAAKKAAEKEAAKNTWIMKRYETILERISTPGYEGDGPGEGEDKAEWAWNMANSEWRDPAGTAPAPGAPATAPGSPPSAPGAPGAGAGGGELPEWLEDVARELAEDSAPPEGGERELTPDGVEPAASLPEPRAAAAESIDMAGDSLSAGIMDDFNEMASPPPPQPAAAPITPPSREAVMTPVVEDRPLTLEPEKPEPTGRPAEIAKKQGMVWRQLPGGQHGWIPKDRLNERHAPEGKDDAASLRQYEPFPRRKTDAVVGRIYRHPAGVAVRYNGRTFERVQL